MGGVQEHNSQHAIEESHSAATTKLLNGSAMTQHHVSGEETASRSVSVTEVLANDFLLTYLPVLYTRLAFELQKARVPLNKSGCAPATLEFSNSPNFPLFSLTSSIKIPWQSINQTSNNTFEKNQAGFQTIAFETQMFRQIFLSNCSRTLFAVGSDGP